MSLDSFSQLAHGSWRQNYSCEARQLASTSVPSNVRILQTLSELVLHGLPHCHDIGHGPTSIQVIQQHFTDLLVLLQRGPTNSHLHCFKEGLQKDLYS